MARIIITVIFLIAIAVLIILNVGANAAVNIFGWKVEEMPVAAIAIVSFVAGVVYSFIFYLMSYFERGRRERLERKKKKLKDQEADLKTRESEVGELASETRKQLETVRKNSPDSPDQAKREETGLLRGLFGRKK
jgi:uncharacterized integral membrane protein